MKTSSRELFVKKLKPYIKGAVCGFMTLAVMSVLSAVMYNALGAPEGTDTIFAVMSLVVACAAAGFFCAGTKGRNGLASGAVCGLAAFILTLAVSIISGSFTGEQFMPRLILCVVFAAAGGVAGVNLANR